MMNHNDFIEKDSFAHAKRSLKLGNIILMNFYSKVNIGLCVL